MTETPDISVELPHWHQVLSRVLSLRAVNEEADITYPQLIGEELGTEGVAEMMVVMAEVAIAAAVARKAMENELARRMADDEVTAIEVAGQLVTWKPKKKLVIENEDGFWEYMMAHPEVLPYAFNPNTTRKTGVPSAVFDTFFREEMGVEPVMSTIPMWKIEENRNKRARQE